MAETATKRANEPLDHDLKEPNCPTCGKQLDTVLKWMGEEPEGYVCEECSVLFSLDLKHIAKVY